VSFDVNDHSLTPLQIEWEHRHLRRATAIVFWFPHETLCPITLYELGAWSQTTKPLLIGTHMEYAKRLDVIHQTRLSRPDIATIHDSLSALIDAVERWFADTKAAASADQIKLISR
jgi:hypothetical protein